MLNGSLAVAVSCRHLYTCIYRCVLYSCIGILYMQVLAGCLTVTVLVLCRHVYTGVYILYSCIHMYMGTYMYILCSCMHTHGLMHVQCTYTCRCSMDVSQLYSNRQNWCPAAFVYIYMYLQVCTVQLYAHT